MTGKILVSAMMIITAVFAAGVYYSQVYGYYYEVEARGNDVQLTTFDGRIETILSDDFDAIDADSSPIRYRACFSTPLSQAMLSETFEIFDTPEPRNAPHWFDCFDAEQIGNDLVHGQAIAFMGQENISYGVDRIVAIYPDGRGFVWHQLNDCGDKLYDGTPTGDNCPERE